MVRGGGSSVSGGRVLSPWDAALGRLAGLSLRIGEAVGASEQMDVLMVHGQERSRLAAGSLAGQDARAPGAPFAGAILFCGRRTAAGQDGSFVARRLTRGEPALWAPGPVTLWILSLARRCGVPWSCCDHQAPQPQGEQNARPRDSVPTPPTAAIAGRGVQHGAPRPSSERPPAALPAKMYCGGERICHNAT